MPQETTPSPRRNLAYELLSLGREWWQHRISFLISLVVTAAGLLLYLSTFVGERPTPIFEFAKRLELDALDTRFRYRAQQRGTAHDPRIVIVDIDQRSQEVLGRWPFSRSQFARMLDVLREDGARVAAFDITFSRPDDAAAPLRELRARLEARRKAGDRMDPQLAA